MKRSQSSKFSHVAAHQHYQQQHIVPRSLFPPAGCGAFDFEPQQLSTTTKNPLNASAAAAGRSLLNRPNHHLRVSEHNREFSASAADTPLPPLHRTGTDLTLKSCLSSSSTV
ncbi:hypothetical protein ACHAXM_002877, partial [Skeletonema potamos]